MPNFWAQKLAELSGEKAPESDSATIPVATGAGAWWGPHTHSQNPSKVVVATLPNTPPSAATVGEALAMVVDPRLTKAQSARNTETCPECGSGDYRGGLGANEMKRCFDCGYNPRFMQQAAGIPSDKSGSATPSRQVPTGGYNPQQVIGRIG